jgi:hypothetical protein
MKSVPRCLFNLLETINKNKSRIFGTISVNRIYFIDLEIKDTTDTWTAYPSGAFECNPRFYWGSCYSISSFICMFCRSLFFLLYFFLFAIALSVLLLYMDNGCPFGIFKLFILQIQLGLLHTLIYTLKLTMRAGKEQNFMTNNMIVKFHL